MAGIPEIASYEFPRSADIGPNIAGWRPDAGRAVVLVHDMQRFFLRPLPEAVAQPLVARAEELLGGARARGVPIAYTAQPGGMDVVQRGLLKDFWGPGMAVDPADRDVVGGLAPRAGDWHFTKWRYSAFFKSDLLATMRAARRDQLILCGVYAHIGILATAIDSFSHDIETFIAADAVAGFSSDTHRMALAHAASTCAVVMPAGEVWR